MFGYILVCVYSLLLSACVAEWDASDYWNDRYGTEPDFEPYTGGRLCEKNLTFESVRVTL